MSSIKPDDSTEHREWVVEDEQAGQRIDFFLLTLKCDGYSRVFLRRVVQEGHVCVDVGRRSGETRLQGICRPAYLGRSSATTFGWPYSGRDSLVDPLRG